jgi:large subunit ribosomal protein L13Ae
LITAYRYRNCLLVITMMSSLVKYHSFLRKRTNTRPADGPFHWRSPSRILWRVVRGMLPHKRDRGQLALGRLKVYEGIPPPFDRAARQVVPSALRILRLRPERKYCRLGDLASAVGWQHNTLIKRLEEKRKVRSAAWYKVKKIEKKLKAQAIKNTAASLNTITQPLIKLGFPIDITHPQVGTTTKA